MLKKLLKYEFRSVFQTLLPLYGALLAVGLINNFFYSSEPLQNLMNGTPMMVFTIAYVGLMAALFTLSMILIIQRFYKGLLSEEGYLMFTLPVKPWEHLVSKMICSAVILILSGIVAILSMLFLTLSLRIDYLHIFKDIVQLCVELSESISIHWILYIVEAVLLVLIALEKQVLKTYASMSLGHLSGHHRAALSFAAYAALGAAATFCWATVGNLLQRTHISDWLTEHLSLEALPRIEAIHLMFVLLILWQGIEFIVYFLITHQIISKHLNLE